MDTNFEAGVRINDFKIMKSLGTGGMGIVYLARQVSLNRPVALKILGPMIDDPKARARFRREARAVALLKHSGIAEVYYAAQDDKLCYMATEYIDGATLRQALNRLASARDATITLDALVQPHGEEQAEKREIRFDLASDEHDDLLTLNDDESGKEDPVTPEAERLMATKDYIRRCCAIVRDAALALEHAHQKGVTHRDIKPENLMLDRQGGIHVIDFGVARFRDDVSLSSTGALVGTPMYMSPEHITGRVNIDHRSDIYSLGIVLYEFLTLRCPHSAPTREGILRQIVNKTMPPVGWRNRGVTRDLEAVVHKAIARDPDERYATAAEFAQELQNVLDGKPVAARPYRYRFDSREIAAERPAGVTITAFTYFFIVLAFSSAIVGYALSPTPEMSNYNWLTITLLFTLFFIVASFAYFIGSGLIAARKSAMVLASSVNAAVLLFMGYDILRDIKNGHSSSYAKLTLGSVLLYSGLSLCLISLIILNRPSTRRWVRYAAQLRSEHRRQARSR